MGILSKLFASKKQSNVDVFSKYSLEFLELANIPVNDANKLKATVYLCFVQIACINVFCNLSTGNSIDNIVEDAKESILESTMKIKDLALNRKELDSICKSFPKGSHVNGDTIINGLGAWQAVYSSFVEEVVYDISDHISGPFGPHGYAAIKILEAMRGPGKSRDQFMEVTFLITEMTGDVIKGIR